MPWAAVLLLVAGHLLGARELRELGSADDARAVPHLERALEWRLEELEQFPASLPPPDLEEEIVAALLSLERLEPELALSWARTMVDSSEAGRVAVAARRVVARSGDSGIIRIALRHYFDDREGWGRVLGDAAATHDVRLRDFRQLGRPRREPTEALFRSRLARALGETIEPPSAPSFEHLLEAGPDGVHREVLALPTPLRDRAVRFLATYDHLSLVELPMTREAIDRLYPYLARSRHRELRDRLHRARAARGRALASLLLSPRVDREEKRRHADAMGDAWLDAIAAAGRDLVTPVVGDAALERAIGELPPSAGLIHVETAAARTRLERAATPEAIRWLGRRSDTVLSLSTLTAFRSRAEADVRRAAEIELLRLGAPGSSPWLQSRIGVDSLGEILPAAVSSPVDADVVQRAVASVGSRAGSEPLATATMSRFHERDPGRFLEWLRASDADLRERAQLVMALSGDRRQLPLLVELAVSGQVTARDAALRGLAEVDLGDFDKRLHRLAGDPARSVRFQTAVALVPTGAEWAFRLLFAELDENDPVERLRARRAVERLPAEEARTLFRMLVSNETATPFAIELYLDLGVGHDLGPWRERLWRLLVPHVEREDPLALAAAARLLHPDARAAVERFLERR